MSRDEDTDTVPLDGKPFTEAERKALRHLLRFYDRSRFAWKLIFILVAWLAGLIGMLWATAEWIMKHIRWGA